MKTNLLNRLATLVVALFVTSFVTTSWGQGSTRFQIYNGIVTKPTSQATLNGIAIAAQSGNPASANWTYISNGSTIPLTQIFNYGTTGSGLRYSFALENTNSPFMLTQVEFSYSNPVFGTTSGSFSSYSNVGFGVNAGADGRLGTADDVVYASNNGNAFVHGIYMIGLGTTIDVGNTPVDEAINSWKDFSYQDVTYSLLGETASSRINFCVPEPASSALLMIGLISLHTLKKKK